MAFIIEKNAMPNTLYFFLNIQPLFIHILLYILYLYILSLCRAWHVT